MSRSGSIQIWIRPDQIPTRAVWIHQDWIRTDLDTRPDLITTRADLDPPVLDPSRSGSGRIRFRPERIWIRPDQIPNGTDLIQSEWIQSEWIRTDLDPVGSGSGSVRIRDLDSTRPGSLALVQQDLSYRKNYLLSCGKIFPVAKSLKLFALLRQDLSCR